MSSAARAFDHHRQDNVFRRRPESRPDEPVPEGPWRAARNGEVPPVMFQLRFRDGTIVSHAYGDLREIRFRDAGHLELGISGMTRRVITIEGRNLRDLIELLGSGLIYWLQEADERDIDAPEAGPCIDRISLANFREE